MKRSRIVTLRLLMTLALSLLPLSSSALAQTLVDTKTINPGIAKSQRTFTEESIGVYGDIALLICRSDFVSPQGQKLAERVLRVFTRRGSQWLLLRHAATPLAP
jgi:ketosteroid isomerase-like protein